MLPRVRALPRAALTAGVAAAAALVAVWVAGRLLSDRYAWSQWLLWIPTPAALLASLALLAAALRPADRPGRRARRLATAGATAILVAGWLLTQECRPWPRPRPAPAPAPGPGLGLGAGPAGLRLVHWNTNHPRKRSVPAINQAVIDLDADLVLLSHPAAEPAHAALIETLGENGRAVTRQPFSLFSRLEVLEARDLVAARGAVISMFRVDATEALGRPLVLYAVDLPSAPGGSRAEAARFLRRALDEVAAPPPDIVLGDFNMTRHSAAMEILFPGYADAYDQAGWGWAGTFPRRFPLYHVDHCLVGAGLRADEYRIVDPGAGRHRLQVARVRPDR